MWTAATHPTGPSNRLWGLSQHPEFRRLSQRPKQVGECLSETFARLSAAMAADCKNLREPRTPISAKTSPGRLHQRRLDQSRTRARSRSTPSDKRPRQDHVLQLKQFLVRRFRRDRRQWRCDACRNGPKGWSPFIVSQASPDCRARNHRRSMLSGCTTASNMMVAMKCGCSILPTCHAEPSSRCCRFANDSATDRARARSASEQSADQLARATWVCLASCRQTGGSSSTMHAARFGCAALIAEKALRLAGRSFRLLLVGESFSRSFRRTYQRAICPGVRSTAWMPKNA